MPGVTKKAPEPPEVVIPEPEQENVSLRELPNFFSSDKHYRLEKHFSKTEDLWEKVPVWAKDDIYIFDKTGKGWINSNGVICPQDPFASKEQNWKAYADDEGIKFEWVDLYYKRIIYTFLAVKASESFTVYYKQNDIKIYSKFVLVGN